jgi:hypothetical protein
LLACFFLSSCLSVQVTPKDGKRVYLKDKKVLIVTHDTELTQEYIIYLKNHLRLLLSQRGIDAHGVNMRYVTTVAPRSIKLYPYIVFKGENSIPIKGFKMGKLQNAPREVMKEDKIALSDSLNLLRPDYIIDIDTQHERRAVYFTFDSNTQELKNASFDITFTTPEQILVWRGTIVIDNITKVDMLSAAKRTANKMVDIITTQN